jgi:hypothetical protein
MMKLAGIFYKVGPRSGLVSAERSDPADGSAFYLLLLLAIETVNVMLLSKGRS